MLSDRNDPRTRDDRTFQVDIFVAFFAILIIVATALIGGLEEETSTISDQDFATHERISIPFSLPSWRLIFQFNDLWIVRDATLYRLDTTALAQAMARGEPLFRSETADDFSRPIPGQDPGQVQLDLRLRAEIPAAVVAESVSMEADAAERFTGERLGAGPRAPYFFVWSDQVEKAAALFESLKSRGIAYRWIVVSPRNGRVVARRGIEVFSLEAILR